MKMVSVGQPAGLVLWLLMSASFPVFQVQCQAASDEKKMILQMSKFYVK